MKSRQDTLRVLLDTSFILPSRGIDVGIDVSKALKSPSDIQAETYYSRFSMLESLWVAARLSVSGMFDAESFSLGLRSIVESGRYRKMEEDSKTFTDALRLHALGNRDRWTTFYRRAHPLQAQAPNARQRAWRVHTGERSRKHLHIRRRDSLAGYSSRGET